LLYCDAVDAKLDHVPKPTLTRRYAALLASTLACAATHAAGLTVSAASSLTNALREVAPLFEAAQPGMKVNLNFGASGALLAQAMRGAPVDVFLSADAETMEQAEARGLVRAGQRRDLLANTLVVIVPAAAAGTVGRTGTASAAGHSGNTATPGPSTAPRLPRTLQELAGPGYARIALGLPASVPAGRYTQAALEAARLWEAIQPRIIGAQNVRQALDYVARGEVDAGFVYATDAALMPNKVRVAFTVPTAKPILYPVATLAAAPNPALAARFVEFLFTPPAQAVFARHGFARP
jgi:molybdate transport system substrate-binding protein